MIFFSKNLLLFQLTLERTDRVRTIGGVKNTVKLFGDVREQPGYFLWKLNEENRQNSR